MKSHFTSLLRTNQTPQEAKLWYYLRANRLQGLKFKRQQRIDNYIVDFCCISARVIVELDGGQHNEPDQAIKDKERQQYIESRGYRVLRFWNNEIDNDLTKVLEVILAACVELESGC